MNAAHLACARRNQRRLRARKSSASRHLTFQPLESRHLLAGLGDWAVLDLRSALTEGTTLEFKDLSGVVFHGDQVAVTANVKADGGDLEGRLVLVDVDLDGHTAQVGNALTIPSLGGKTEVLAVNSNGSVIYMTGYSVSDDADAGEAYRAIWDGTQIQSTALGYLPGENSPEPVFQSIGIAVNRNGVIAGSSDNGRAIFEYDQAMVRAGEMIDGAIIYGISDDRVKVGIDITGVIWEDDNSTRREVADPYGDGVYVFGISPDHSVVAGSSFVFGVGGYSIEKLMWWDYDGTAHVVQDNEGNFFDGRLTSATNGDVGYHVGRSNPAAAGDLLHIRSTNETLHIVEWFESLSGQSLPAETSVWGPEITYDADSGRVAIISGGYLFTAIIHNEAPVALADAYTTPVNVPLVVDAPGVLGNDTDDGIGVVRAVLVDGPDHGTLQFNDDGSFTYTPRAEFNREDSFTYKANDGDSDSNIVTVAITMETEHPWHNGLLTRDVNDDGSISPVDALQIINRINAFGTGPLASRPHPLIKPFYDVAPDNFLTPLDALRVINYLNANPPGAGEGEGGGEGGGGLAGLYGGSGSTSGDTVTVFGLMASLDPAAKPLVSSRPATLLSPLADRWVTSGWEIGCAQAEQSRDAEIWAQWGAQRELSDLDELLSVLPGPATDEG